LRFVKLYLIKIYLSVCLPHFVVFYWLVNASALYLLFHLLSMTHTVSVCTIFIRYLCLILGRVWTSSRSCWSWRLRTSDCCWTFCHAMLFRSSSLQGIIRRSLFLHFHIVILALLWSDDVMVRASETWSHRFRLLCK